MYVNFVSYTSGSRQVVGTARLDGSRVVIEGHLSPSVLEMLNQGIPDRAGTGVLTLQDGETFLRALPHVFSGSYFRAGLVLS